MFYGQILIPHYHNSLEHDSVNRSAAVSCFMSNWLRRRCVAIFCVLPGFSECNMRSMEQTRFWIWVSVDGMSGMSARNFMDIFIWSGKLPHSIKKQMKGAFVTSYGAATHLGFY